MPTAIDFPTAGYAPAAPIAGDSARAGVTPRLRWDPLLIVLAVYLLAAVGRIHQLFPILLPLKPILVASALAVGLFFLLPGSRARRDPQLILRPGPLRWMGALLVWAVLSVPGALWVGGAYAVAIDALLKTVLMAAIVAGAVRGIDDVERMAAVYFAAIALYSTVVLLRFDIGGEAWRLNDLYYYDANDFATIAVTGIPLGLHFVLRARRPGARVAAALGLLATVVAFAWTGSRGGFVAVLAFGLFFLFRFSSLALRWRVGAVAGVALLLAFTASDAYWEKMRTILAPQDDYNLESHEGRKAIWGRGIGYMLQHPVLGVGAGNFPTAEGTISPRASRQSVGRGVKWQAAHNSFVQIGAELGIPGLLFFLAMLGSAFAALLGRRRQVPADASPAVVRRARALGQALAGSLVGFVVGAFFLSLAYVEALYLLVALAAGLRRAPEW
jgi:O-antigen ligase